MACVELVPDCEAKKLGQEIQPSASRFYPSHAHPGPTWQISFLDIQVLPHALPAEQILQHANDFVIAVRESWKPRSAKVRFAMKGVLWTKVIEVACESPLVGGSECAPIANTVMTRARARNRGILISLSLQKKVKIRMGTLSLNQTRYKSRDPGHDSQCLG
jgi:hypothetical protein